MKNKLSILGIAFIIAVLISACSRQVKEENQNNLAAHPVPKGQKYNIDTKQSAVTWKGSMLVGANSHSGYVYISKGELMISNGRLTGGTATIDMNTIEDENHESNNGLIKHLKDPDFFEVEKFPVSTIVITKAAPLNGTDIKVSGNLTIKGITQPVTFPARMEITDKVAKMGGRLAIDRTKWNVRYKSGKFYDLLADETMSDSIEFHIKVVARNSNLKP